MINEFLYDDECIRNELYAMTDEDRVAILDPICESVRGKRQVYGSGSGIEVMANREFALMVLDLYEHWQRRVYERD